MSAQNLPIGSAFGLPVDVTVIRIEWVAVWMGSKSNPTAMALAGILGVSQAGGTAYFSFAPGSQSNPGMRHEVSSRGSSQRPT